MGKYIDRGDPAAADYGLGTPFEHDNVWHELDLSSPIPIVPPAGANNLVLLRVNLAYDEAGQWIEFRTLGNVNTFNEAYVLTSAVVGSTVNVDVFVKMDANRKIEYRLSGTDPLKWIHLFVTVRGWVED